VANASPALAGRVFEVEQDDDTLIVLPTVDLRKLDYLQIETAAKAIVEMLHGPGVKNVVVDFDESDHYGSGAIEYFLRFWKAVRERGGCMAFCNLTAHEREILRVTNLDHVWRVCSTRAEALEAVQQNERLPGR
jgi:anti-anti-sigma factor